MSFVRTLKISTDPLCKLLGRKPAVGFDDLAFAMHPFGFDRVEPGAFGRQQEGQNVYPCAFSFDAAVVLANPGTLSQAFVPGSVIPNEQPGRLALLVQKVAASLQELRSHGTDWPSIHKAQRHLITLGLLGFASLPQYSITGQSLWIRIALFPGLFHQVHRVLWLLPGVQPGQSKSAPPHFIQKTNGPAWLGTRPGDQAVACRFF